jgi:hypothetical protein
VTAGNVTITAADGSNPRFDLVVVDSAGAKSAVAGTAAANPVFADPAGKVVLAAVYVPAADTDIDANQIIDKRIDIKTEWAGQGSDDYALYVNSWTYSTGLGTLNHSPLALKTLITATDTLAASDLVTRGLYTVVTSGPSAEAVVGTLHSFTHDMVVSGAGDAGNEYSLAVGNLRVDIGTGFSQTGAPVGRMWLTDWKMHGPIAVQPALLQGISAFVNNYYNGSPTSTPSTGLILSTKKGGGGGSATHQAADTYPIDAGIAILGKSNASAADGVGWTKGIQIGGSGGGWSVVGSILGTGIDIEDWQDFGIRIGTREASGTGPGLAVDSDAGGAVIGSTTLTASTTFEVVVAAASQLRVGASVLVGSAALATNATDGFLYIPTCAGVPTGTPTAATGLTPIVFDSNNRRLYIYDDTGWWSVEVA